MNTIVETEVDFSATICYNVVGVSVNTIVETEVDFSATICYNVVGVSN